MKQKKYHFQVRDSMTIRSAFEDFLTAKVAAGLSFATIRAYRFHFEAVCQYFDADQDLDRMTTKLLREVVAKLARTDLSRNSIRSYTATLKTFTSWLKEEGLCDAEIALFRGEDSVRPTYTQAEILALLRRPKRRCTFCELRNWVIVNVLVNNGCRAGTVRAMQVRDVDLNAGVIRCRHTKNRKALNLPLSPSLSEILSEYLRVRKGDPEDPLFCDANGYEMTANCLRNAIVRYNRSRGVDQTSIHAFRHTFAKMYLTECGGNALKLQRLLGHSTLDMTKKYVRIYDEDLVDDFKRKSPLEMVQKNASKQAGTLARRAAH